MAGHTTRLRRPATRRAARAQPGQVKIMRYKVCIVSWMAPGSRYKKIVSWLRRETLGRDTSRQGCDTAQQCTTIRRWGLRHVRHGAQCSRHRGQSRDTNFVS